MPNLYIIAGCNGAGKTTASYSLFPDLLKCSEFVNADLIAAGLSPFNTEHVAFEAGRIMLARIRQLIRKKTDFAFETTLSTRSFVPLIEEAKNAGYEVNLVFLRLQSPELAAQRVANRVEKGGHNIPKEVISRRFYRGMSNLSQLYIPVVNRWAVIDNSTPFPLPLTFGTNNDQLSENRARPDIPFKGNTAKPIMSTTRVDPFPETVLTGLENAGRRLVTNSARRNEKLVMPDERGEISQVPARSLLPGLFSS